jgi:hypothetical protein
MPEGERTRADVVAGVARRPDGGAVVLKNLLTKTVQFSLTQINRYFYLFSLARICFSRSIRFASLSSAPTLLVVDVDC